MFDQKSLEREQLPNLNKRRNELASVIGPDGMIYALGGFGGAKNEINIY